MPGGVSGIFKPYDYARPYYERPPYNDGTLKSVFHVRQFDYVRLAMTTPAYDLFVSHDWPQGIARYGDMEHLFRNKPYLRDEVLTATCCTTCGRGTGSPRTCTSSSLLWCGTTPARCPLDCPGFRAALGRAVPVEPARQRPMGRCTAVGMGRCTAVGLGGLLVAAPVVVARL